MMSSPEAAAVAAIQNGDRRGNRLRRRLMRPVAAVAAECGAEAVEAAVAAGLAELWVPTGPCDVAELAAAGLVARDTPADSVLITLTPRGALLARRLPRERWEGRPKWGKIPTRVDEPTGETVDDARLVDPPRLAPVPRTVALRRGKLLADGLHAVRLAQRDPYTNRKPRELLVDSVSGSEMVLFAGPDGKGQGVPVQIDPRMGPKPKGGRGRRAG